MAMYAMPLISWPGRGAAFRIYDDTQKRWRDCAGEQGQRAAELLDARSFISVPLKFRGGQGRVYMTATKRRFTEADAIFLMQIVDQVLPVIENIHLLDRLASLAALRERRTIAHDLHDSTVQPYIGLSHTLSALRNKAGVDNPLKADIDALSAMTAEVVSDLRRFAGGFARKDQVAGQLVHGALRRHVQQAKQFYDIDIALDIAGEAHIGDRMAAAVLQLASEGINNICKHTDARNGALRIVCEDNWLSLEIENESTTAPAPFVPRSITHRSNSLGGRTRVEHRGSGITVVRVEIPV
jgi:signal transduction histidine kinase